MFYHSKSYTEQTFGGHQCDNTAVKLRVLTYLRASAVIASYSTSQRC